MESQDLSAIIIECCLEVHKTLGPGLLESAYEEAVCFELAQRGIPFSRQQIIPIEYKDNILEAGFRADIIVNDAIIIEIKSVEKMSPTHFKQLLTYLRLTNKRLGLLINFNEHWLKDGIQRVVNGYE